RLHHQRGFGDAEAGAAEFLRHRDAEPSRLRKGAVEIVRKAAVAVLGEPIRVIEALAQAAHGCAKLFLRVGEADAHVFRGLRGLPVLGARRRLGAAGAGTSTLPSAPLAASRAIAVSVYPASRNTSMLFSPRPGG